MIQAKRVICFVPNDTVDNYIREIRHWAPHRQVYKLAGLNKQQRELILSTAKGLEEAIFVVNYEAWRKDLRLIDLMAEWQPDSVIIDEAHNVKDTKSIAFRGINKLLKADNKCPNCGAGPDKFRTHYDQYTKISAATSCIACEYIPDSSEFFQFNSVKCVLPMTGTPILNKPQDLFALLNLVDPVEFSYERRFLDLYATQDIYTKKWKFQTGGLERLTKRLAAKFVMRDRHSAGIVIPPQDIQYYDMVFDAEEYPEQAKVLSMLNRHAAILLKENEGGPDEILPILYMIALITRKRQAIVWPAGIQLKNKEGAVVMNVSAYESIKLDKIIRRPNGDPEWSGLIPELIGTYDEDNHNGTGYDGERVVVFSQFKQPLIELEERLREANIPVARFDGDTKTVPGYKEAIELDFDAKYCNQPDYKLKYQVVLCNYKSGGVGLNFTGASQMIILDEEWNPGKADQAMGRIDRMGQTKETTVHVLRVKASIDTWMASLINEKAEMVEGFESNLNLQQELYDAITNGDIL
jgi:SNF2 family DNA or RNA helicase